MAIMIQLSVCKQDRSKRLFVWTLCGSQLCELAGTPGRDCEVKVRSQHGVRYCSGGPPRANAGNGGTFG